MRYLAIGFLLLSTFLLSGWTTIESWLGTGFAPVQKVVAEADAVSSFPVDLFLDWRDFNYNAGGIATWVNSAYDGAPSFDIQQPTEAKKPTLETDCVRSAGEQGMLLKFSGTVISGATTSATLWMRMKRRNIDPLKYFFIHENSKGGKSITSKTSDDGTIARIMGSAGPASVYSDSGFFDTSWHVYAVKWSYSENKVRVYKDGVQFGSDISFTYWIDDDGTHSLMYIPGYSYGSDADYKYIAMIASACADTKIKEMSDYMESLP